MLLILGVQLLLPLGGVDPVVPGLAARRGRPVAIPPAADYRTTIGAPIFAPDRRPGSATAAASPAATPLGGYAALGTVISRQGASAVVSGPAGQPQVVHRGDTIAGWRLVAIEGGRLIFLRQGERHVLVVGAPPEPVAQTDAASQ